MALNRGAWKGHRIVPEAWIDAAAHAPQVSVDERLKYGSQRWLSVPTGGEWLIGGIGNGGYRFFTIRSLNLVFVTPGRYNQPDRGRLPGVVLEDFVPSETGDQYVKGVHR